MAEHNLFESLLSLHSSSAVVPAENFLTEVFAHFLRTDPACRDAWLSVVLARPFVGHLKQVNTREGDAGSQGNGTLFPDMTISGTCASTGDFTLIAEHKWASPCSPEQLRKYLNIAERKRARLVFVAPTERQLREAATCLPGGRGDCFGWWQVYTAFKAIPQKSPMLETFLEFMEGRGLSPIAPIRTTDAGVTLADQHRVDELVALANRLRHGFPWESVPKRFIDGAYVSRGRVRDGVIGVFFTPCKPENWRPAVVVGFLCRGKEHKVRLTRPPTMDIMVRVAADPKVTTSIDGLLRYLDSKRAALQRTASSVLLKNEVGNGNPWTIALVRSSLADVISTQDPSEGQLEAIYDRVHGWLQILFENGSLEDAFKACGLGHGVA